MKNVPHSILPKVLSPIFTSIITKIQPLTNWVVGSSQSHCFIQVIISGIDPALCFSQDSVQFFTQIFPSMSTSGWVVVLSSVVLFIFAWCDFPWEDSKSPRVSINKVVLYRFQQMYNLGSIRTWIYKVIRDQIDCKGIHNQFRKCIHKPSCKCSLAIHFGLGNVWNIHPNKWHLY